MSFKRILATTQDNSEWATPRKLFEDLNAEFRFTLDPCATDENHLCERYYTKEQDGLAQDWSGETVYMNPPYHRHTADWVRKAYFTHTHNRGPAAGTDGHGMVPRLHLWQGRNTVPARAAAL